MTSIKVKPNPDEKPKQQKSKEKSEEEEEVFSSICIKEPEERKIPPTTTVHQGSQVDLCKVRLKIMELAMEPPRDSHPFGLNQESAYTN